MALVLWVPISALDGLRLVHGVSEGARLGSVRDGYRCWLTGDGLPLPPIEVTVPAHCECRPEIVGHHTCGELRNGHHRLAVAREMGIPVQVAYTFDGAPHARFGWPVGGANPAAVRRDPDQLNTHSRAAALPFCEEIRTCIELRQKATGQSFDAAARDMFARFTDPSPLGEVKALAWALSARGWEEQAARVAHAAKEGPPIDPRSLELPVMASIKGTRDALDRLVQAIEGGSR